MGGVSLLLEPLEARSRLCMVSDERRERTAIRPSIFSQYSSVCAEALMNRERYADLIRFRGLRGRVARGVGWAEGGPSYALWLRYMYRLPLHVPLAHDTRACTRVI